MKHTLRSAKKAMRRILGKNKGPGVPDLSVVPDPRKPKGKRYDFTQILQLAFDGMLGGYAALRGVIALGERLKLGISYYALYTVLSRLFVKNFRPLLHNQVKSLYRAKALTHEGLPCHVVAIDGKSVYFGKKKINKFCQKTKNAEGRRYYHMKAMRATLTSSPLKLAIDQQMIPGKTNEMGCFKDFFGKLIGTYGRGLLHNAIFTMDAGMASWEHATLLDHSGQGYVFALKADQKELFTEAGRLFEQLCSEQEPERVTGWFLYQGKEYRFKLYRSEQMRGWETDGGCWEHLRQTWMVVTERRCLKGRRKAGPRKNKKPSYTTPKVVNKRYYLTNLLWNYLKPEQILRVVRGHWGIENGSNWLCDVIWNEDDAPWCRKKETVAVLSLMRLMACNMLRWLKHRVIRSQRIKKWGWAEWLDWIRSLLSEFIDFGRRESRAED